MADETQVKEKVGLFKKLGKNWDKTLATLLTSAALGGGSVAYDSLSDMQAELSSLSNEITIQNKEIETLRSREMDNVWRSMYLMRDKVNDNTISIGSLERFVELSMADGTLDVNRVDILLESLRTLVDEDVEEYSPQQVEDFRQMQQKLGPPPSMKK